MAKKSSAFELLSACRDIQAMPDGSKIKPGVAHTLLVLATYSPDIRPGQARLAKDLKVSRSMVNVRLRELDESGLIYRLRGGGSSTTKYGIRLWAVRKCAIGHAFVVKPVGQEVQEEGTHESPSIWDD